MLPIHPEANSSIIDLKKKKCIIDILKNLYFDSPKTILQLSKILKISVPTCTIIVNELLEAKILNKEGEGEARSGRKPIIFDINKELNKILVIDVTQQETTFFVTNLKNETIEEHKSPFSLKTNDISAELTSEIKKIAISHKIWAIGISLTGLIGKKDKFNYSYPALNQDDISLETKIGKAVNLPTFVIHNTEASILGEKYFGSAKNKKDVLLLNVGWGLSLGIITNGDIVRGLNGFSGEIGHIQINPDGKLCKCGKVGCLETVASALTLVNEINEGLKLGKVSSLQNRGDNIEIDEIINAIIQGDNFAIEVFMKLANELGRGISIAVHLFNPELIIIDGLLAKLGNFLNTPIEQSLHKYCISDFKEGLEIKITELGSKAKLLGVSSHVFEKMLE